MKPKDEEYVRNACRAFFTATIDAQEQIVRLLCNATGADPVEVVAVWTSEETDTMGAAIEALGATVTPDNEGG